MSAILISLNAHNFPIFQPILMKLVSKSLICRALSYKIYLSGLRPPLNDILMTYCMFNFDLGKYPSQSTIKFLNFLTPENFAVMYLKF